MSGEEFSKVKVVVRVRPSLKAEASGASCVEIESDNTVYLRNLKTKNEEMFEYK